MRSRCAPRSERNQPTLVADGEQHGGGQHGILAQRFCQKSVRTGLVPPRLRFPQPVAEQHEGGAAPHYSSVDCGSMQGALTNLEHANVDYLAPVRSLSRVSFRASVE
ncbi:MAG: hypothetical protein ABIQ16_20930 [Polyangiaceae bacterium]